MTGHVYNQIFTQLARNYEFVTRDESSGIRLRMKAIGAMNWRIG